MKAEAGESVEGAETTLTYRRGYETCEQVLADLDPESGRAGLTVDPPHRANGQALASPLATADLPKQAKDVLFDLSMVESSANAIREEIENLTGQARAEAEKLARDRDVINGLIVG